MVFTADTVSRQDGRTFVITGANTGLGFHNALDIAAKGAKVVLACRTESRAEEAMQRIADDVRDADLEFVQVDLSSLDSVRTAAAEVRRRHPTLDVLINNAGVMMTPYTRTADGFEGQMASNHWGHFLWTMSLIDLLHDTPASRVVSLSSLAHRQAARIRFDDIHWERSYSAMGAYRQSKLACLLFALELDRRLRSAGSSVVSTASHPGVSETELGRSLPKVLTLMTRYTVAPFFTHSPAKASLPTLMAAVDPNVSGGEYFGPSGVGELRGRPDRAEIHHRARNERTAERLWDLSVELTGADLSI